MTRLVPALVLALAALSACTPTAPMRMGPDGTPLPQVYRLSRGDTAKVQYRMLDAVNALRQARGAQSLELDPRLNAAAATHSRDMSVQNRPWHFGSDGSSPLERVQRAGFQGKLRGESLSETYETELETLAAWMEKPDTRNVVLDPEATHMGFAYFQEPNGKIWWTLVTGRKAPAMAGL
ncbi:Cysteine-rich secretory protein family protein [Rhodovulum sp. ES.010]|uniref:CAP domain-containing protein n=1 Tax=Rhodovulum sp. ES.010 TaxID=1882821 RepID=UPI00092B54D2|nr:CAP domain-containing protein [Rhodovulum sp. ES.010]SIO49210.1 Cysteine-rich secretory protein family protein [Rhodovulum sp. ES.010]